MHTDSSFTCKVESCDKTFKFKDSLKYHNKVAHEGLFFKCDQCDFQSNNESNFKKHVMEVIIYSLLT